MHTPDPYEIENAPDDAAATAVGGNEPTTYQGSDSTMTIDPVHQQSYEEFAAFIEQDLLDSAIEWTTYEAEQHRRVEGMFGCGDVDITVEARVDFDGTIPFVAVRTPDTEAMLDVDGIDRLITALAWARQDLMRLAGDLT